MFFLQAEPLQSAAAELTDNPVLTEIVDTGSKMNLWEMTTKGGWIMLLLAILSVVCFYIFFERLMVLKKARQIDASFMDRIRDYVQNGEVKSAINFCRVTGSPIFTAPIGKTPQQVLQMHFDAVSGATYSSEAVIENLRRGVKSIAE